VRQDVGEPRLRIHIVHLCGDDQAVHHGGTIATTMGAAEQPRLRSGTEMILSRSAEVTPSSRLLSNKEVHLPARRRHRPI
jgi:hypothetical protein